MALPTVEVGNPVTDVLMNQIIERLNNTPGRTIRLTSGTFTLPAGVHCFKVTLCGGGGGGGASGGYFSGEENFTTLGGEGGDAPMVTAIFKDYEPGQSIAYTVGAAGAPGASNGQSGTNGGTTSFGDLESAGGIGGSPGPNSLVPSPGKASPGAASFPAGQPSILLSNDFVTSNYVGNRRVGYGRGGPSDTGGMAGMILIEW